MAFTGYIKWGDIKGGSTAKSHTDESEVLYLNHGVQQQSFRSRSSEGAATTGRAEHGNVIAGLVLDCAWPKLNEACHKGTHIDKIVISLVKPGGDPLTYMMYTLENCLITSAALKGSAGSDTVYPEVEVGIGYATIEWQYDKMDEKGKSKGKVAAKVSLKEG